MTNTVLITRARGDEVELTEALHERGYHVIHEPLTEIFLLHTARPMLAQALMSEPDAIIVTSRHGARALAALTELRDLPLLCVGEATLHIAHSLGFERACATGQNVEELVNYVLDAYDRDTRLLYVSAQHVRAELDSILAGHGIAVERIVVYEAQAATQFSDVLTEQLKRGHIDAVTFLSRRAAEIFQTLLAEAKLEEAIAAICACALSEAIAEPLKSQPWRGIHSADEPTLASAADCVDNALRDRK